MKNTTLMAAASDVHVEAVRVRAPRVSLAVAPICAAPMTAAYGTTVPAAGFALLGADAQATPGSPPREAPV